MIVFCGNIENNIGIQKQHPQIVADVVNDGPPLIDAIKKVIESFEEENKSDGFNFNQIAEQYQKAKMESFVDKKGEESKDEGAIVKEPSKLMKKKTVNFSAVDGPSIEVEMDSSSDEENPRL